MRSAILLLLAAAFPSVAQAGPCAIPTLSPSVMMNAPIEPGGGVVVALLPQGFGARSAKSAVDKAWRFKDVNALVVPTTIEIAPGLAVYSLPPTGGPELTLVNGDGRELAKVTRADKTTKLLDAPVVKSVVYTTMNMKMGYHGIVTSEEGVVTVDGRPAGAAMLVVYEVTKTGNVARNWASLAGIDAKQLELVAFRSGGRCSRPQVPGIQAIAKGTKVVVAWLDSSGRLSAMSKPIEVKTVINK